MATKKNTAIAVPAPSENTQTSTVLFHHARRYTAGAILTLFALLLLLVYLSPFGYMGVTALKSNEQIISGSLLPASPQQFEYQGELYDVVNVPTENGIQQWALVEPGRTTSQFIDPANPSAGLIEWEGRWRGLERVSSLDLQWNNFAIAFERVKFPRMLFNTAAIAVIGVVGTLISCTLVAYGFARFPIPGKNVLFIILISTIILPRQVTLVPTYAFFAALGWTGTWLPLLIPHFFANAYNVFLLRQYFMTLPRELDEAAMIDGANPFQILLRVMIPQAYPVLVAVGLFHFVFAWNDYFEPLLYLINAPELQPISVGIQQFNDLYTREPALLQATCPACHPVPALAEGIHAWCGGHGSR